VSPPALLASGSAGVRATSGAAGGRSSPSRILAARATSGPPRFMRNSFFCSSLRGAKSAPPMNDWPVETAVSESPNIHSAAQSEMPGTTVLSVGDATQPSLAGAGAAAAGAGAAAAGEKAGPAVGAGAAVGAPAAVARATPAGLGTSRIAARTGSGVPCRAATLRPRCVPAARVIAASRFSNRRPMCGLVCRGAS
jgi:hypothetical protein